MPATTEPPTPAGPKTVPTMCLLHADFHVMAGGCWSVTFDWFFAHQHLPETAARELYQAEVEQAMLDQHIREHQAALACGGDR
ncbi:hypothetical protein [Streptomyces sp. NBC_00878]|uniref:hypothetical protein n=1 Tax=Streptomyces sp. NBC_00878 TaxID=2975854 RepID=UPI00225AE002|nr:hypothetical protein [Streptomyces sp. NBC_00878]MCX4911895.1 hypothetical protein [Streptomyces sp. NBC_00878]